MTLLLFMHSCIKFIIFILNTYVVHETERELTVKRLIDATNKKEIQVMDSILHWNFVEIQPTGLGLFQIEKKRYLSYYEKDYHDDQTEIIEMKTVRKQVWAKVYWKSE